MVHLPGQKSPRRIADPVSTVAITPTVLEALNITGDFKGDATSLLHPKKDAFLYLETLSPFLTYQWSPLSGLVHGTMKYIRSSSSEELYDLSNDPAEADDLSAKRPQILLTLRNELDRLCPAGPAAMTDTETPELPPELLASLRSLGYLGATGAPSKSPSAKGLPNPRDLADIPGFVNHKGQQLIRAGQLREFFNLAKGILRRDPSNISVINLVGSAYREEKNYARSEEILLQGLSLAPNDYYLLAKLGKTEALLKKYPESEAHLKKAMEINPFLLDAYVDLTQTYLEQGKSSQADAVIETAFGNRIRHPLLLSRKALLAIDRKDCAAAIPYLKEALANDPALLEAIGNLIFCHHRMGNLNAAWETVQKGLALAPKDFQMLQTAFGIAYGQKRMDKAKEIAVTFVDLYGLTEEARRMRQIFPEIGP